MTTISKSTEVSQMKTLLTTQQIRQWLPTAFMIVVAGLLVISAFMLYGTIDDIYWEMHLDAPQYEYRGGLDVIIYIDRMEGKDKEFDDLRELNSLNHYIGMRNLDDAAILERQIAIPSVKIFSALLVVGAIYILLQHYAFVYAPRNLSEKSKIVQGFIWFFRLRELKLLPWLLIFPALLFPLFFMLDLYFWLEDSGQNLDLNAPFSSSIHPFTPTLRGEGEIGQFHTVSDMAEGWYTATNASALLVVVLILGVVHFGILQYNAYQKRQADKETQGHATR